MDYVDLQDSSTTLSASNPSHQFAGFRVPNADLTERPILTFRVNPEPDPDVRLELRLNNTPIVDVTFNSGDHRAWQEIVEDGLLLASPTNNILTAEKLGSNGSVSISDVVLTYKT